MHTNTWHRWLTATAVLIIAVTGVAAPAHALEGPVATDDFFATDVRGTVSGNVLANDSWDPEHTATLADVTLRSASLGQVPPDYSGETALTPALTWTPDGNVTVDFGAYPVSGAPAGMRAAEASYTLVDSAGQTATGLVRFREANPVLAMNPTDDDNASLGLPEMYDLGSTTAFEFRPFENDVLAWMGEYTVEIVDQPTYGTISEVQIGGALPWKPGYGSMIYDGGLDAYPSRTDSWTYRVCLVSDPSQCSSAATISVTVEKSQGTSPGSIDAETSHSYWVGGPLTQTITPMEEVRAEYAEVPGDYSAVLTSAATLYGTVVENGDGTWTYIADAFPEPQPDGWPAQEATIYYDIVDGAGVPMGVYKVHQNFVSPLHGGEQPPVTVDDEAWVAVGDRTSLVPFANDEFYESWPLWEPVGAPAGYRDHYVPHLLTQPTLGAFDDAPFATGGPATWADQRAYFNAGATPGTDLIDYRVCPQYPAQMDCSTATMTVHVSPISAATDDIDTASPGETVDVPVLSNDVYTDTGSVAAAVAVTALPEGVTATVTSARTVAVTVPAGWTEPELVLGYRLTDFTGTSDAQVIVTVASAQAPPPDSEPEPVVEEPTPQPEPTPEAGCVIPPGQPACDGVQDTVVLPLPDDPQPEPTPEPVVDDPDVGEPESWIACSTGRAAAAVAVASCVPIAGDPERHPSPDPREDPTPSPPYIDAGAAIQPEPITTVGADVADAGDRSAAVTGGLAVSLGFMAWLIVMARRRRATA